MIVSRQRRDRMEGFHNSYPRELPRRLPMMRIPHIPASVTALMAVVVFVAPLIVMLVLRSPN